MTTKCPSCKAKCIIKIRQYSVICYKKYYAKYECLYCENIWENRKERYSKI